MRSSGSTARWMQVARSGRSCGGASAWRRPPSSGSGGLPCHTCRVSERRWSLVTLLVATAAFVVVAAVFIPWHPVPGGTPAPVPESEVFTRAQIARANAYSDTARHLAWASLAVSLLVSVVLGLTPIGRRLAGRLRGWWWVRVLLAVAALAVVGRLVTLPFASV